MNYSNINSSGINNLSDEQIIKLIEKYSRPATEIILDDVDLRKLLNVSRRTTLNYRASGKLKYFKVEQKTFYFLSDIISFIKSYAEEA